MPQSIAHSIMTDPILSLRKKRQAGIKMGAKDSAQSLLGLYKVGLAMRSRFQTHWATSSLKLLGILSLRRLSKFQQGMSKLISEKLTWNFSLTRQHNAFDT